VLDRFFTVLTITPSFLVRFWPVKCRIEALITFFRMVKERSVRFSFRSGQRSGQTLVKLSQPWSNLVKILRTLGNVSWAAFRGFLGIADPSRVRNGLVKLRSNLVNSSQTWSNLVRSWEMCPRPRFEVIWCDEPSSEQADLVRATSFCVSTPEKIPGVKMGL
jgi:hypothetical protein